jgi:hypothetical protein
MTKLIFTKAAKSIEVGDEITLDKDGHREKWIVIAVTTGAVEVTRRKKRIGPKISRP